jgi:hypothetical protein
MRITRFRRWNNVCLRRRRRRRLMHRLPLMRLSRQHRAKVRAANGV